MKLSTKYLFSEMSHKWMNIMPLDLLYKQKKYFIIN